MNRLIAALTLALLAIGIPSAQADPAASFTTTNQSAKITTGLTFQVLSPATTQRRSLTIQNNNATDACNISVGSTIVAGNTTATNVTVNGVTMTAAQASVSLAAGQSYTRYYPVVPNDPILGTCATTGDSIYVATE